MFSAVPLSGWGIWLLTGSVYMRGILEENIESTMWSVNVLRFSLAHVYVRCFRGISIGKQYYINLTAGGTLE